MAKDKKKKDMEAKISDNETSKEEALNLIYMNQRYHDTLKSQQYVVRGSVLSCQYGTKYARIDLSEDYGVYKNNQPVVTCVDCKSSNIHNFGSCLCPESNYMGRLPMNSNIHPNGEKAVKKTENKYAHICVPYIASGWKQFDEKTMIDIGIQGYAPMMTDNAVLVCQYGGIIYVREVNSTAQTLGKEELFKILDLYLQGKNSDSVADDALIEIAGNQTLDIYAALGYSGKDLQRYDSYIIGWTEYYNDRLFKNTNMIIKAKLIKAMMWKESKMGYGLSSSPNANVTKDVMQVLDPRNPTIYEFCTYNLDTSQNVKMYDKNNKYDLVTNIESSYNHKKTRTTHNTPIADRLFKNGNDGYYYYQYQESSPILSIALGLKTYSIKLQAVSGNSLQAVQEYNNSSQKVDYMNDVDELANQGGFINAEKYS